METMSDCGSALSVAELMERAIFSVSKQKIFWVLNGIAKDSSR